MPRSLLPTFFSLLCLAPTPTRAAELRVLPAEVTLTGPQATHFVLTRQALGRRVDRVEPARSLFLLKPTRAMPHAGGRKVEVGSPDYHILADWIASGAPGPRADDPRISRLEVLPSSAVLRP